MKLCIIILEVQKEVMEVISREINFVDWLWLCIRVIKQIAVLNMRPTLGRLVNTLCEFFFFFFEKYFVWIKNIAF